MRWILVMHKAKKRMNHVAITLRNV